MSRLITGAFGALMALGFLILLAHGRLDEALMALAEYLRGQGQMWIWASLCCVWGVMSAGMIFSQWRKTAYLRIIGQCAAIAYLLFLVLGIAKFVGNGGEPDLLTIAGLGLSGLCTLFFFLKEIDKHFERGEVREVAQPR